ncbi:MAG TPA: DNA polymerase III subunit gamma and tau [Actinoplanes sp.]|nr:DNA polymerase III subunit gamma and tau [Actinoplanes sp.]
MALALYRKYRPRTFAEVIGQEHVTEPLSQALRSGRLNHAYLFSGPRGCGKTSSARILARSLNCEQGPTPEPCGECMSCKSLANDGAGSIDVIEIDAASHGGVDDARELREKAFFAPASSRFKIYVIDEAHMVSSAGFNALLKLVEEPPDYVKFIFATTEPDKVLGTIRSRTHHYPFRLIPPAVLRPYLQQLTDAEGVTVAPSVLPLVVRAGGGSARDSLSILDQLIAGSGPDGVTYAGAVALLGVTDSALIDEMCDAIATGQGAAAYATIDRVAEAGHEPRRFASDLLERFRDLIVLQQVPDAVAKGLIDGPADQLEAMAAQAASMGAATLSRCADTLHNGLIEMRGTTAPRLLLELVTARMLLPGADVSTAALLQRLERLEQGIVVRGEAPASSHGSSGGAIAAAHSAPAVMPSGAAVGDPAGDVGAVGAAGGGAGAAKAAAMAAARAASNRQSATPVRPVSPAPAPAVPVPAVSAAVDPGSAPPAEVAGPAEPDWNQVAAGQQPAVAEEGHYDEEPPPWDEEPSAADEPVRRVPAGERPTDRSGAGSAGSAQAAGQGSARVGPHSDDDNATARPEAAQSEAAQSDGRLERVRAAWQDLGQNQAKVKAMQDYGIGVREVDGDLIVFAAPTQALVDRFLNWKDAIAAEFRKSPGGDWRIRCEVGAADAAPARSGSRPAGPGDRRDQSATHQAAGGAPGRTAPAAASAAAPERNSGRTESRPSRPQRAPAADADDDWPAAAGSGRPDASDRSGRAGVAAGAGQAEATTGPGRAGVAAGPGRAEVSVGPGRVEVSVGSGRAESAQDDSGWPEPARPGGARSGSDGSTDDAWPEPAKPGGDPASAGDDDSAWPEPVRPGGGLSGEQVAGADESPNLSMQDGLGAGGPGAGGSGSEGVAAAGSGFDDGGAGDAGGFGAAASGGDWPATAAVGAAAGHGSSGQGSSGSVAGAVGAGPGAGGLGGGSAAPPGGGGHLGNGGHPGSGHPGSGHPGGGDPGGNPSGGNPSGGSSGGGNPGHGGSPGSGGKPGGGGRPESTGGGKPVPARSAAMEAARAAARLGAGAGTRTAEREVAGGGAGGAGTTAAGAGAVASGKPSGGGAAQARAAAAAGGAPSTTWADGSPIGEAPYDPEYDGPPSGAALEGFDPGDEPLDEVIDEKTARASSEEQAMQLLREAFGAEKSAELS